MTIASRLILCRRSRPSRPHDDDAESSPQPSLPRARRHHNHREELEFSPHSSHHGRVHSRRSSSSGHESARLDYNCSSEFGTGSGNALGSAFNQVGSRLRSFRNEQLPGAVLEARARLLERLRSVSLSETSRQTPATEGISWDEFLISSDFNLINSLNWEAENRTDFSVQTHRTSSLSEPQKTKLPGYGWDTLRNLSQEVFTIAEADGSTRLSLECGICLEKFNTGDKLIKLQCTHRFHLTCLEPWVRTSGDCPYCRASIIC